MKKKSVVACRSSDNKSDEQDSSMDQSLASEEWGGGVEGQNRVCIFFPRQM